MKYVFCRERAFIEECIAGKEKSLIILCGRGVHAEGDETEEKQPFMKRFVRRELETWVSPIAARPFDSDNACLECDAKDLEAFLARGITTIDDITRTG